MRRMLPITAASLACAMSFSLLPANAQATQIRQLFIAGPMTLVHTNASDLQPSLQVTRTTVINGVPYRQSGSMITETPGIREYSFARVIPQSSVLK